MRHKDRRFKVAVFTITTLVTWFHGFLIYFTWWSLNLERFKSLTGVHAIYFCPDFVQLIICFTYHQRNPDQTSVTGDRGVAAASTVGGDLCWRTSHTWNMLSSPLLLPLEEPPGLELSPLFGFLDGLSVWLVFFLLALKKKANNKNNNIKAPSCKHCS